MPRPPVPDRSHRADATAEDVYALLRDGGGRITQGRRAVIETLIAAGRRLTADELVEAVRTGWPGVNESTVYRTLDSLERLGVVRHTHLGHGAAHWQLFNDNRHFLLCENCGAVADVPASWLRPLIDRIRDERGFELATHHFALSGHCAACVAERQE